MIHTALRENQRREEPARAKSRGWATRPFAKTKGAKDGAPNCVVRERENQLNPPPAFAKTERKAGPPVQNLAGYIEVGSADGVVVAEIHAANETDTYFFTEKFIGRLVAWFLPELAAINIQFRNTDAHAAGRKKKKRSRR